MKRVTTITDDAEDITAVKSTWDEDEANALLANGWMLLHGGVAHKDAAGFQAKAIFILGKKSQEAPYVKES